MTNRLTLLFQQLNSYPSEQYPWTLHSHTTCTLIQNFAQYSYFMDISQLLTQKLLKQNYPTRRLKSWLQNYTVVIMLTLYNGNGYFTFNVDLFFNFLKHIKDNYKWDFSRIWVTPGFGGGPCCSCFNSIRCVFTLQISFFVLCAYCCLSLELFFIFLIEPSIFYNICFAYM